MKRNKIISAFALLCAASMILTGCGAGGSKKKVDNTVEDKTNLVIMVGDGGYGTDYIKELAKAFEAKNEGVKVTIQVATANSSMMSEAIKNIEGNDVDLFFGMQAVPTSEELKYSWNGEQALRDMTYLYNSQIPGEEITLGEKVNASAKLFSQAEGRRTEDTSDDVYYGIPCLSGLMGLYYNETVINNALGEGNWTVPNTSDELLALCERLKEKDCYFLMPGGMDGYSRSLFMTWWAQYEGYENFLKFYEGIGYDKSKNREVENSYYIYSQPGRKASLEASYELVGAKNGYILPNSIEINVAVLNEYQSRFFIAKNNYAFYPCGSWLPNEVVSGNDVNYDSTVKMMQTPIISSIIESTDSYSGTDDKRLPNITSDAILSQVVSYVDGKGELPAGVTEEEVEIIRQTRRLSAAVTEGAIVAPAYSNAKALADEFILFMVSDEGLKIIKENTYGSFPSYKCEYSDLDATEQSMEIIMKDVLLVDNAHYHPLFYRGGISGLATGETGLLDSLLCKPNGKTGTEIFEQIVDTYNSTAWSNILQKVQ